MSESSGSPGPDPSTWVPYCERQEWEDVKGVEQDEGPNPVAKIAYTKKFEDVFDYFRAIVKSGEVSKRALDLTKDAVDLNPANYTVWHHRRMLLRALNSDIDEELEFCRASIEENPKNYQVWQHRRALVEWKNDGSKELRLTEIVLSGDQKNYHAWQHRQWAIQTFGMFDKELEYTGSLLEIDVRNNSAWNERFFVITNPKNGSLKAKGGGDPELKDPLLSDEVQFAMSAIEVASCNESAWNYLRGLVNHAEDSIRGNVRRRTMEFCQRLYDQDVRSAYLQSFMVDLLREEGSHDNLQRAAEICNNLATTHDVIRKEYWQFTGKQIALLTK